MKRAWQTVTEHKQMQQSDTEVDAADVLDFDLDLAMVAVMEVGSAGFEARDLSWARADELEEEQLLGTSR